MDENIVALPILIDDGYSVVKTNKESITAIIPGQKPITQIVVEVVKNNKKAYIFFWDGNPPRDLGQMVAKTSWQHRFLGEDVIIVKTVIFMGEKQEVLVLHHDLLKAGRMLIYSKEMDKDAFHELLGNIHHK